jgi:hypothetical protein
MDLQNHSGSTAIRVYEIKSLCGFVVWAMLLVVKLNCDESLDRETRISVSRKLMKLSCRKVRIFELGCEGATGARRNCSFLKWLARAVCI